MRAHGRRLGTAMCEALGLDPTYVRDITLRCHVQEAALVTLTMVVPTDAGDDMAEVLSEFHLVEKDKD